ncbi:hypothetical protein [Propionivibrio sp.]|uniref:hypothetical protein n=1 Tax=Propionivibrio sp. TaxID=2212460 RepID=UPI00272E2918|nr:hypothetical protein [Propionivibrio sp.]
MALRLNEDLYAMLFSGNAEEPIYRFINTTMDAHASGIADSPYADDALIAALALMVLLQTPDGRRALNLKRLPRGRKIDKKQIRIGSDPYKIALHYYTGEIDEKTALDQLAEAVVVDADEMPDIKTLRALLSDLLEDTAEWVGFTRVLQANPEFHESFKRFFDIEK